MLEKVITGVTGDQVFPPCFLFKVRVGGTAALLGTVQIKRGATVIETLAIATAVGIERHYENLKFDPSLGVLNVNPSNAADTVIVLYN
jgi:hypothetical protein